MIITRPKQRDDVLAMLEPHARVGVLGCGLCATACGTGGDRETREMASFLTASGKEVVWTHVVDGVCQRQLTRLALGRLPAVEAVLVMACGGGAQTVSSLDSMPAYPALDTLFLGSIVRPGRFEEKCSLCGECLVGLFSGRCPVTLCPKSMLNGPCGGMEEGRCEVDADRECVWYSIWQAKEAAGRLDDLRSPVPPRSHRRAPKR